MRLPAALLAVAALAAPATAAAAPPWSQPAPLGPVGAVLSQPRAEGAVVSFGLFTGDAPALVVGPRGRVVRSAVPSPVAYGATRVLHLRESRGRLGVSFGRTDGTIGAFRPLWPRVARAVLDADARGNAVVAWVDRGRVLVSRRRAGGSFGRAEVVRGSGTSSAVAVGVGDGRAVVAWQRAEGGRRRVELRVGDVARGLGRVRDVGPALGVTNAVAEVAGNGRATVVWQTQDGGEEPNVPAETYAVAVPTGSSTPGTTQLLSRSPSRERPIVGPSLDSAPNGDTTVAFTEADRFEGGRVRFRARTSSTGAGTARFRFLTELGPGVAGRVAVEDGDADVIVPVVEDAGYDTPGRLLAFVRPPLAAAFTAEEVAPAATAESAAGFAGEDGPAVVVFARPVPGGLQGARARRGG